MIALEQSSAEMFARHNVACLLLNRKRNKANKGLGYKRGDFSAIATACSEKGGVREKMLN